MQLTGVTIRNIRSFEQAQLDLTAGTTLIVGDVGAGKSSLLYAIEMALFGVAEVDAAYLVRHGRGDAEVEVRLADRDHVYEIARRFRRVRRSGRETFVPDAITFRTDRQGTSYSATELRQRVIELVGFPDNPSPKAHSDLWRWAIYVPQERMREILAADPESRLETVRKALGVERFRIAADNAGALASDLKSEARRLREEAGRLSFWDTEHANALREIESLAAERGRQEAELRARAADLETARRRREELERASAALTADVRELEGLRREAFTDAEGNAALERQAAALTTEADRADRDLRTARSEADRRGALTDRLARLNSERDEVGPRAALLEADLRDLAAAHAMARAAADARRELVERSERIRRETDAGAVALAQAMADGPSHDPPAPTQRRLGEIETLLEHATARERMFLESEAKRRLDLERLDELLKEGVCPTCHQGVKGDEFATHRSEADRAHRQAVEELSRARLDREQLDTERRSRERYERAHERWVEVDRHRTSLREGLDTRHAELATVTAALAKSPEPAELASIVSRVADVERQLGATREASSRMDAEREQLSGMLEGVTRAEERVAALGDLASRCRADLSRLETERKQRAERMARNRARIVELENSQVRIESIRVEADRAKNEVTAREESVGRARDAIARSAARTEALSERVALAEKGRADRAARVAESVEIDSKAQWIAEPFRIHLLTMEREILSHAQVAFDRAFSRYFAALIDDPGLVARTDSAFTPEVAINGQPTPAEALSGGERTSLALAFRLALAHTVRSLGQVRLETLLLDEPTDGFSAEQVVRMGELLGELALPQVIVVSHEAQLAGIADRTVRVVKTGGRSTIEELDTPGAGPKVNVGTAPPVASASVENAKGRPSSFGALGDGP